MYLENGEFPLCVRNCADELCTLSNLTEQENKRGAKMIKKLISKGASQNKNGRIPTIGPSSRSIWSYDIPVRGTQRHAICDCTSTFCDDSEQEIHVEDISLARRPSFQLQLPYTQTCTCTHIHTHTACLVTLNNKLL